jgi:RNA polymerase sigma-70 factor, ECF subfamily
MHSRPAAGKSATSDGTVSQDRVDTPTQPSEINNPDYMWRDDPELIAKFLLGQSDAATTLFRRYWSVVCRIARRIIGDDGEAEETAQQVFFEVFRNVSGFDPGKGHFRAWLFKKATSRAINRKEYLQRRRFYQFKAIDEEPLPSDVPDISLQLSQQEVSHLIDQLLTKLPAAEYEVIRLIYFEGLTASEAANKTGKTMRAVRYALTKALNELRSMALENRTQPNRENDDSKRNVEDFPGACTRAL